MKQEDILNALRDVEKKRSQQHSSTNLDEDWFLKEFVKDPSISEKKIDVKPLFHLVEDILNRAIQNINSSVMDTRAYMEDETHKEEVILLREKLSPIMDRIAYKIAYNTSSKGDSDDTIRWILNKLNEYPWEAKLILTLTAFALNYGECWHLALIYSSNQLAKSISMLKQVAYTYKPAGIPSPPLEAVNDLVLAMMDATRCIFRFQELGDQIANASDEGGYSHGLKQIIPITIYWIVRSVLASASQITSLTSLGFNYVISHGEKEELMFLTEKLNIMKEELEKQAELCQPALEEARMIKRLDSIKELLNTPQVENMIILRALIYYKDDQQPLLYDCKKKKHVMLDVLRKKVVLLLISDVDIPEEVIESVKEIYNKTRDRKSQAAEREFETVWIPIVEQGSQGDIEEKFKWKREAMQWYTVHSPSLIAKEVIKLAKEEWYFENQPIIVVIDPQGQVASPNAFPMIHIWKSLAYPFTSALEEALWKDTIFDLDLLVGDIFPQFQNLIEKGNDCVCLYGGEDMGWIKMFTARTPSVAEAVHLSPRMVYVGKSKMSSQVKTNIHTIQEQSFSYVMDERQQQRFWTRITNLLHSRMLLGKTIYEDPIIQEINSLLNLDASEGGWAAFFTWDIDRESVLMTIAEGKAILDCLNHFTEWRQNIVVREDFIPALEQNRKPLDSYNDGIKHLKSYQEFLQKFKKLHRIDYTRILKSLISATDYSEPLLFDGVTRKRVKIDFVRPKELLMLVSDLDILEEDIAMLEAIMRDISPSTSRPPTKRLERQYDIVWVPIVDPAILRNENGLKKFESLQGGMPWFSVLNPSMINETAIKFIKKVLRFDQKTLLVVLDQQGHVTCPNALHMMWIWSIKALPFTTSAEELLWQNENWGVQFLLNGDPYNWVQEGRYICLYGGEDLEWIRRFTKSVRGVAEEEKIKLAMVYVGRSNPNKRVRDNISRINEEGLSDCSVDLTFIWYFWVRIESMWRSKSQLGKTPENDHIMEEIMKILNFDRSEGEWAILASGTDQNQEMITAKGDVLLECFNLYCHQKMGFMPNLKQLLLEFHHSKHCNHLIFPITTAMVPDRMKCSECSRPMERYIMFKCCDK